MTSFRTLVARLRADERGMAAIETALVAPVLILMSIGGFEVSRMVARQHELQGGAIEATAIALAANQGAETDVTELEALLEDSLGLTENEVTVTKVFRCDADTTYVETSAECENDDEDENENRRRRSRVSSYISIELSDTYTPTWSHFVPGGGFTFHVDRMAQIS